jgi:hypothetical protein
MMRVASLGCVVTTAAAVTALIAAPATARSEGEIDPADTAWMIAAIALFMPLRVDRRSEIEGLDLTQHGEALQ